MGEVGIDISAARPKALTMEMLDEADRVVTMGCGAERGVPREFRRDRGLAARRPQREANRGSRRIRDEIRTRVQTLVQKY